jgi:hypothetical protein
VLRAATTLGLCVSLLIAGCTAEGRSTLSADATLPAPPSVVVSVPLPAPSTRTPAPQLEPVAEPLDIRTVPVPPLKAPHYETTGSFPQVSHAGLDLIAVNLALKSTVIRDQDAWSVRAIQQMKEVDRGNYTGTYDVSFDPTLMVANTVLVSTLYPVQRLFPGGNDGSDWLATSMLVPSGKPVVLPDLFRPGSNWLEVIADETRREDARLGVCTPPPDSDMFASWKDEGLAPKASNYRNFAITPDGLDFGLPQGQLGSPACGAPRFTLAWESLERVLSTKGRYLAAAAGQGLSTAPCSLTRLTRAFEQREAKLRNVGGDESGVIMQWAGCVPGWSIGVAARPGQYNVGQLENLLFRSSGFNWVEVAVLPEDKGYGLAWCDLTNVGVPLAAAKKLLPEGEPQPYRAGCGKA